MIYVYYSYFQTFALRSNPPEVNACSIMERRFKGVHSLLDTDSRGSATDMSLLMVRTGCEIDGKAIGANVLGVVAGA